MGGLLLPRSGTQLQHIPPPFPSSSHAHGKQGDKRQKCAWRGTGLTLAWSCSGAREHTPVWELILCAALASPSILQVLYLYNMQAVIMMRIRCVLDIFNPNLPELSFNVAEHSQP